MNWLEIAVLAVGLVGTVLLVVIVIGLLYVLCTKEYM